MDAVNACGAVAPSHVGRAALLRMLGAQPYVPVWHAMQRFTDVRDATAVDELWVVEHEPVFTRAGWEA